MKKTKVQHAYFQSKFNRDLVERFEIQESIIGFDHFSFKERIIDELNFLGISKEELAKSIYISKERMQSLLKGNIKFTLNEIWQIRKRLNLT